jgi:hypothetical protein
VIVSVPDHFRRRALATWASLLRRLFREGRIRLVIGLGFQPLAVFVGESIAGLLSSERHAILVEESLIIAGWAALWTLASRFFRSEETDWDLVRSGSRAANSRNRPLRTNVPY